MAIQAIFLDDGGVMNDNKVRGPQWNKLIADYFAPRYGGEKRQWMKANVFAMTNVIDFLNEILEKNIVLSHQEYLEEENKIWTEKMFEYMGLNCPPSELYEQLHNEVDNWVIPQVQSAYPGIIETIKKLSKQYILHTASNESSTVLDLYLRNMNSRGFFTFLFGPDLVGVMKSNIKYYKKIFSYAKIKPTKAVVIDDNANVLYHAQKTHAMVIQSCLDNQKPEFENFFTEPIELMPLLKKLSF